MVAQTGSRKTKVFISYSRKNKPFVSKLNTALDENGIDAWVDWEGIPLTSDWMAEITAAIEGCDAFVFVISPDSLKSKVCADELELGLKYNKKIVPVLYADPEKGQKMHPKLASTNWVYLRPKKDDFKTTIPKLIEAIQTDLGWVQQHTRLLQRASEWENKSRNNSYLLQGSDLSDGETWMTESTKDVARAVVPLQAEYISTSRKAAITRQRNLTIGIGFVLALTVVMGFVAILQWQKADENAIRAAHSAETAVANEHIAATQKANAEEQKKFAEESEARAIASANEAKAQRSAVQAEIYSGRPAKLFTSTLLALESWTRMRSNDAEDILRNNVTLMATYIRQVQHNGRVWNITVSPDGTRFVTASDDKTACVWTMGGEKNFCVQHNDAINDALFSMDNKYLVTASADGVIGIWNADNGESIQSFDYGTNIWDIDISPNNKWLAVGRDDGRLSLIDLTRLKEELSFFLGDHALYTLSFSPTNEWLAMGATNGQVTLWRVNTGQSIAGPRHSSEVYAIDFSPDGNWVVSVGADSTARVARTFSGGTKYILPHNDWVEDVAFAPDGSWFTTVADDKLVRVFDTDTGVEKFRVEHQGFVIRTDISPDGQWIASTGFDNTVRVWESASGSLMREIVLDAPGSALSFSADNSRIVVGDRDGRVSIWDISASKARVGFMEFPELIHKAKFDPTGQWVVFNTDDKNLWLIATDQLTSLHDGTQGTKLATLENITSQTKVSPNSKWIAVSETYGSRANLINVETKTRYILPHDSDISGMGFSGNSNFLATTNEKGTKVHIWDVESGALIEDIQFDMVAFTIAFNPKNDTLAIGFSGKIVIWDIAGKKEIGSLPQIGDIKSLNYSPDGHWLATTNSEGGISLWEMSNSIPTEARYKFIQGGSITSLEFNKDGSLLSSGGSDGYAYIWDLSSGEERARLPHGNSVSGVSFSPINDQLITVSQKVAQIWDISQLELISTEDLDKAACAKLPSNFSSSDWAFFFHGEEYRLICPNLPAGAN